MNKMVKGSIAGAAGVALLMGSFGTYAVWTDSVTANGGVIQSGALEIRSATAGKWTETSTGQPQAWDNYGDDRDLMVPGDVVVLAQPLEVAASGKNLRAQLSVTGISTNSFAAESLKVTVDYAGVRSVADGAGPFILSYDTPEKVAALNTAANQTADEAVVTIAFKADGQTDQGAVLDLSAVKVELEQLRPGAANQ